MGFVAVPGKYGFDQAFLYVSAQGPILLFQLWLLYQRRRLGRAGKAGSAGCVKEDRYEIYGMLIAF